MHTPRRALAPAVVAVGLAWIWMSLTVHYNYQGNWTALFCIGERFPAPPILRSSEHLYVFHNSAGYDGQFYHDLAHDPLLRRDTAPYIDAPKLRARRILVPLLAWLLALGHDPWIDTSYFAVMLGFLAAGVFCLALYAARAGRSEWWGLLYLLVPSTLISIDRMTVDLPFVTLFLAFAYCLRAGSLAMLSTIAAFACLTRETGLCIVAGYAAYLLWRRHFRQAVLFATSAVPFLLWMLWVRQNTLAGSEEKYPFAYPLASLFEAIVHPQSFPVSAAVQTALTAFDFISLAALIAAMYLACRMLWHDPPLASITVPFVAVAMLLASLSGMPTEFTDVYAYGRPFSPIFLAVVLDALARRSRFEFVPFGILSLRSMVLIASQGLGVLRALLR